MPFKSDKQRKFLFAEKPDVAKKFVDHAKRKQYNKGACITIMIATPMKKDKKKT